MRSSRDYSRDFDLPLTVVRKSKTFAPVSLLPFTLGANNPKQVSRSSPSTLRPLYTMGSDKPFHELKIGILGGGQLGKMMIQDASKLAITLHMMDKSADSPAAAINPAFTIGNILDEADVLAFGKDKDIVSIEIEAVHVGALEQLQAAGVKVYPQPEVLRIINDKGLQKQYYQSHGLATSAFLLADGKDHILQLLSSGELSLPFVQKARTGGYDGKGVVVIRTKADLNELLPVPSICEALVDIDKELSVIVARTPSGEVRSFPVAEQEFHPTANLVECLYTPSRTSAETQAAAITLAESIAEALEVVGLLAVELFLTQQGDLLINEVAPRPHNSGHHTIEGAVTSQFEQHLRAITDSPLGDTTFLQAAVMVNLLGDPDHTGPVHYRGLDTCLAIPAAHMHLYGKAATKPYRKMGHATVTGESLEETIIEAKRLRDTLKIISK